MAPLPLLDLNFLGMEAVSCTDVPLLRLRFLLFVVSGSDERVGAVAGLQAPGMTVHKEGISGIVIEVSSGVYSMGFQ